MDMEDFVMHNVIVIKERNYPNYKLPVLSAIVFIFANLTLFLKVGDEGVGKEGEGVRRRCGVVPPTTLTLDATPVTEVDSPRQTQVHAEGSEGSEDQQAKCVHL